MQLPPAADTADQPLATPRRAASVHPAPVHPALAQFDVVWNAILAPATPPLPAPIASPAPTAAAATSPQQQSGQGRQRPRD